MLLAVLSYHMNMTLAKHVDLTIPFDGLIAVKVIAYVVVIASNV
jgi:hypothetical protein